MFCSDVSHICSRDFEWLLLILISREKKLSQVPIFAHLFAKFQGYNFSLKMLHHNKNFRESLGELSKGLHHRH